MTEQSTVAGADRSRLFGLASALLTYPDARLLAAGDELRAAVDEIGDDEVRTRLATFLDWFLTTDPIEVETHYVHTFDLRRRSGLYLTYYLHGDTRKRGIALLTLKQRYRAHGLRLADGGQTRPGRRSLFAHRSDGRLGLSIDPTGERP